MMDLKQLRHFVAIVDCGAYSAAAQAVAISQPALTRSIQTLEARLGVRLLNRSTRGGLEMTAAGARLYDRAKLILNEANALEADLRSGVDPSPPLRIGAAPMFAADILPPAVTAFANLRPDLQIQVFGGLFTDLATKLVQGELDVVLSNLPFSELDDSLVVETLYDIDVVYVASTRHPLAIAGVRSFNDLIGYPWAVVDETYSNDLYDYIFASQGETRSPIRLRTNSLSFLKSIVRDPPWISLLPRHMAQADIEAARLAVLDPGGASLQRKGGLLYRRAAADDRNVMAFANHIRAACADAA